jgi:hypothetical protein
MILMKVKKFQEIFFGYNMSDFLEAAAKYFSKKGSSFISI